MDVLSDDIIVHLLNKYLDDYNKINTISCNKYFNQFKYKLSYGHKIAYKYDKIKNVPYYDNFIEIQTNRKIILPKKIITLFLVEYNDETICDIPNTLKYICLMNTIISIDNLPDHIEGVYIKSKLPHDFPITKLPSNLKSLLLNSEYEHPISNCLPKSIKCLSINKNIFQKIEFNNLPNLKKLVFNNYFNQSIKGYIPASITSVTLGNHFNQPIKDCIPNSVIYLKFGWNFNQPIKDCIPNSVKKLFFLGKFNQPIKNCIPNSVVKLQFGYSFDQPIEGCIPNSVVNLYMGYKFNQPIKNCIPESVKYLTFGNFFNQPIINCIPKSVKHLNFGKSFKQQIKDHIPNSVTHLTLYNLECFRDSNSILSVNIEEYDEDDNYEEYYDNIEDIYDKKTLTKLIQNALPISITNIYFRGSDKEKRNLIKKIIPENIILSFIK